MKIKKIWTALLAFALLLSACGGQTGGGSSSQPSSGAASVGEAGGSAAGDAPTYAAEMDKNSIMTVEITADPDEWRNMLDNATDEEYISADVVINGMTIENVGIRPKGNSTLRSIAGDDTTDRYSFKIDFDEYVDGQTWLGLDKLVLNSNYSDASSMKEYLSYDIMSVIGVDTPLYAYADIAVNGETWGFYLALEDLDGSYKERAKNDEGELYKPESAGMNMGGGRQWNREDGEMPARPDGAEGFTPPEGMGDGQGAPPEGWVPGEGDAPAPPENGAGFPGGGGMRGDSAVALIYSDDEIASYSSIFDNAKTKTDEADHKRVIEAIKNLNAGADLERYVDVDATLRYLAAHTVVVNLDSYSGSLAHNYVLYENNDQISMLPWDYNMAFGGFQSRDASGVVNFPIDTPVSGVSMEDRPMIASLLETPEYLETYHQYLQEIIDGYFADGEFEQRVDALDAMIAESIKNDPSAFYTYEEYQAAIAELKKLGGLRAESVQGQLNGDVPSTTDGQTAEPGKLIDASSVDLTLLGGGMGGMGGAMGGDMGGRNRGGFGGNRGGAATPDASSEQPSDAGSA